MTGISDSHPHPGLQVRSRSALNAFGDGPPRRAFELGEQAFPQFDEAPADARVIGPRFTLEHGGNAVVRQALAGMGGPAITAPAAGILQCGSVV